MSSEKKKCILPFFIQTNIIYCCLLIWFAVVSFINDTSKWSLYETVTVLWDVYYLLLCLFCIPSNIFLEDSLSMSSSQMDSENFSRNSLCKKSVPLRKEARWFVFARFAEDRISTEFLSSVIATRKYVQIGHVLGRSILVLNSQKFIIYSQL